MDVVRHRHDILPVGNPARCSVCRRLVEEHWWPIPFVGHLGQLGSHLGKWVEFGEFSRLQFRLNQVLRGTTPTLLIEQVFVFRCLQSIYALYANDGLRIPTVQEVIDVFGRSDILYSQAHSLEDTFEKIRESEDIIAAFFGRDVIEWPQKRGEGGAYPLPRLCRVEGADLHRAMLAQGDTEGERGNPSLAFAILLLSAWRAGLFDLAIVVFRGYTRGVESNASPYGALKLRATYGKDGEYADKPPAGGGVLYDLPDQGRDLHASWADGVTRTHDDSSDEEDAITLAAEYEVHPTDGIIVDKRPRLDPTGRPFQLRHLHRPEDPMAANQRRDPSPSSDEGGEGTSGRRDGAGNDSVPNDIVVTRDNSERTGGRKPRRFPFVVPPGVPFFRHGAQSPIRRSPPPSYETLEPEPSKSPRPEPQGEPQAEAKPGEEPSTDEEPPGAPFPKRELPTEVPKKEIPREFPKRNPPFEPRERGRGRSSSRGPRRLSSRLRPPSLQAEPRNIWEDEEPWNSEEVEAIVKACGSCDDCDKPKDQEEKLEDKGEKSKNSDSAWKEPPTYGKEEQRDSGNEPDSEKNEEADPGRSGDGDGNH